MSDKPNKDEIGAKAERIAQLLLHIVMRVSDDMYTALIALEATKRSILYCGRIEYGDEFTEQARELLDDFEESIKVAETLLDNDTSFVQPGGDS